MSNPKKNSKLDLVKTSSSVKRAERKNNVMVELRDSIAALGCIDDLHNDPSFVQHVCNLVENVSKGKQSISCVNRISLRR